MSEMTTSTDESKIDIIDLDDELSDTEKAEIEVEELEPIKDEDLLILQENGDGNKSDTSFKDNESKIVIVQANTVISKKEYEDVDDIDEDEEDLFEDETLAERLWGLTEMFPETVRNVTWSVGTSSVSCVKGLYSFSRSAMWIIATSAIILAAPALIENEKSQLEELNRQQQRQILLGPGAGGAPGLSPTLTPPTR